jgi:ferredoxin-NADP reductase
VTSSICETATARTLVLDVDGWDGHVAGQHVDLRLTADDGYQATRSYSLSSAPGEPPQITVERVNDGEVSPFLVDVADTGTAFEVRGPIGGYFAWEPSDEPLLLVGGGSGIAPLRAMWRARTPATPLTLLYSAQAADRIIYAAELDEASFDAEIFLTREAHPRHRQGRIDTPVLADHVEARCPAATFVCGPTAFVETVATALASTGLEPALIRTERFG